jgi:pimeloyl-ACP methyl ester carboxylesterase
VPDISRRAALLGGVGAAVAVDMGTGAAVEEGLLPGRHKLRHVLGQAPPGPIPDVEPGHLVSGSFNSAARLGARTGWTIAYPPSAPERLRVLVVLHGRSSNHTMAFRNNLGLDRFLAQLTRAGAHPFAIASVDRGDHSYWHRRSDGSDSGAMVIEEFLPLLGRRGLDVSRVGLLGVSMGGFGALWLATRLGASRAAVVVAESPGLWHHAGDTPSGAFDGAADFEAHTIFGRESRLAAIPLRIDCGESDSFAPATRDLRAAITPTPAGGLSPGRHDVAYWRRMAPAQLRFVASHLAQ